MSAQPIEYPSPPYVSLYTPKRTEEERRVLEAVNASSSPGEAWHHALIAHRIFVIEETRRRLSAEAVLSEGVIRSVLDTVWQASFPLLQRATGPMIAEAYIQAFHDAGAGDVPIKMIYALAEEHSRRVGEYFHGTSSDALIQGFNTYVNRRVPEKAAIARVLDAYGLTPRQMSGLTSAKQFESKVESSVPRAMKDKIKAYIGKSISDRLKVFTRQESHNLNEQAQQMAWMWMVEHGKLPQTAEKMWLTARDERVCAICGPLHRTKIPVRDRFILEDGQKLYVPGAHVNCRCTVRLLVKTIEVGKAEEFDPKEHPRGTSGRFVRATPEARAQVAVPRRDEQLERMVAEAKEIQEAEQAEARRAMEERIEEVALRPPPLAPTPVTPLKPLMGRPLATTKPLITPSRPLETTRPAARPLGAEVTPLGVAAAKPLGIPAAPLGRTITPLSVSLVQALQISTAAALGELIPQIPVPTTTTFLEDAVQFLDRNGAPMRVYFVPSSYEQAIEPYHERVIVTDENDLKSYEDAIQSGDIGGDVFKQFSKLIRDRVVDVMEADPNGFVDIDAQGNIEGMTEIPYVGSNPRLDGAIADMYASQVMEIVQAYANRDIMPFKDETVELTFHDPQTDEEVGTDRMYVADIAESWGLKDEDFEVVVVTLDKGQAESFSMEAVGTRYGEEVWKAPGNYMITGEIVGQRGRIVDPSQAVIPVRVIHVDPEPKRIQITGPTPDLPHDRDTGWQK